MPSLDRARHGVSAFLLLVSLGGCAALPLLIPVALEFARNLLNASSKNYSASYNEDLRDLLLSLVRPSGSYSGQNSQSPQWPVYGPGGGTTAQAGTGVYPPGSPGSPTGNYPSGSPPATGPVYSPPPASPPYPGSGPPPPFPVYANPGAPPSPGASYPSSGSQPPSGGQAPGYPAATALPPIALDVALVRKEIVNARVVPTPIKDGDVLKDGRGNAQAGDKFKIVFRPAIDCYVYVIAIDGSGWAQGLYPSKNSSQLNPVRKDQEYLLPEGAYWYSLDQFRGVETIYVIASYQQRADIEQALTKIAGRERLATAVPAKVEQPPVVPGGFGAAQPGLPAVVKTESGDATVSLTTTFQNQAGQDLRVTRWFRHE